MSFFSTKFKIELNGKMCDEQGTDEASKDILDVDGFKPTTWVLWIFASADFPFFLIRFPIELPIEYRSSSYCVCHRYLELRIWSAEGLKVAKKWFVDTKQELKLFFRLLIYLCYSVLVGQDHSSVTLWSFHNPSPRHTDTD